MRLALVLVAVGLCLTSCRSAAYVPVNGTLTLSEYGYEVTVPRDWYRATRVRDKLVITHDGPALESILIERVPVDTRRGFSAGMPPPEAARIELQQLRLSADESAKRQGDLSVEQDGLAVVAGRPAFRLVYAWRTAEGLRIKRVHYGFVDGAWVYRLIYQATARYYFDRHLVSFEEVVSSFRLLT
jgi:hypothetical protein